MSNPVVRNVNSRPQVGGSIRIEFADQTFLTFLHIPKTGGSSVQHWFFDLYEENHENIIGVESYNMHFDLRSLQKESGWSDNLGTTFTIVRNPYIRYMSLWNAEKNNSKRFIGVDFETWWNAWDNDKAPIQSSYWKGCDIIIEYENLKLELDEKIAVPYLGTLSKLGRYNFVNRSYDLTDLESIIPSKIRDEIYEMEKETFDQFGYEKC